MSTDHDFRMRNAMSSPGTDDCLPHSLDGRLAEWLSGREGPDGLREVLLVVESGRWRDAAPGAPDGRDYRLPPPVREAVKRRAVELFGEAELDGPAVVIGRVEWRLSADGKRVVAGLPGR